MSHHAGALALAERQVAAVRDDPATASISTLVHEAAEANLPSANVVGERVAELR